MIDLHSHILPGIDDGAPTIEISIEMARASVENGVSVLACTPHIMPGVWNNAGPKIIAAVANLRARLDEKGIALRLVAGADVHIAPDLIAGIKSGRVLTLHDSRYILLELPHHVAPPRAEDIFFNLQSAGYVPIFTHPERLSWIMSHYEMIERLVRSGAWMQITAGSLTGDFGKRAQYWAEKMLSDGFVHILASDTHHIARRPPNLAAGWAVACKLVGEEEARHLVLTRPYGILTNQSPSSLPLTLHELAGKVGTNGSSSQIKPHARSKDMGGSSGDGRNTLPRWMRKLFK